MSAALSITELACQYNGQAILRDLDLEVSNDEIVCLLGSSGCGKTTLLKAIAGLLPLESGTMTIHGRTICNEQQWLPPEQRNIGMIFQDYALFPHLTVAENIGFGLKGQSKAYIKQQVQTMLSLVRLSGYGERYPHQLSGGQQQRVAIARALACEPDLLLLDEPFSNVDSQVRFQMIKEIREILKQQGVTAIFVTHSREEAFAFADRLAVMNNGVIEQVGTATELYHQPSSRFVAEFLGAGSYLPANIDDNGQLHTPFGRFPLAKQAVSQLDSASVEWLLRPQNIAIVADSQGEGRITDVQFLGDSYRYGLEYQGHQLVAYSHLTLDLGSKVSMTLQPHQPVVFAKAS